MKFESYEYESDICSRGDVLPSGLIKFSFFCASLSLSERVDVLKQFRTITGYAFCFWLIASRLHIHTKNCEDCLYAIIFVKGALAG